MIGTEPEAVAEILHKTLTEAQKKTLAAELIKGTADLVAPPDAGLYLLARAAPPRGDLLGTWH